MMMSKRDADYYVQNAAAYWLGERKDSLNAPSVFAALVSLGRLNPDDFKEWPELFSTLDNWGSAVGTGVQKETDNGK